MEKPDEKNRVKKLEAQISQLKEALADTRLDHLIEKSRYEALLEHMGLTVEEAEKVLKKRPYKKQSKPNGDT